MTNSGVTDAATDSANNTPQDPTAETVWGELDGVTITFPMVVKQFHAATLMLTVPADAAQSLIPSGFNVLEVAPDTAQMVIALIDYIDNPWGDYNEINLGFLVTPTDDAERMGSFIYRMPVDQEFTCKAGNEVMGFPKVVERIDSEYTSDTVLFRLFTGDDMAFEVEMPRAVPQGEPSYAHNDSFSILHGKRYSTALDMQLGTGLIADPNEIRITLGSGVVADELRQLGLPKPVDVAMWGEDLSATFYRGESLDE